MHLLRGAGPAGLRGMLPSTPFADTVLPGMATGAEKLLVRPLLTTPRAEIEVTARNVTWSFVWIVPIWTPRFSAIIYAMRCCLISGRQARALQSAFAIWLKLCGLIMRCWRRVLRKPGRHCW